MTKKMKLLYLGNDLAQKTHYHNAFATLKQHLLQEGYEVVTASSHKNKILRLREMIAAIFKNARSVEYVLMDTFSTTAFYFVLVTSQLCRLLGLRYIPILHGGDLPKRLEKSTFWSKIIFKNSFVNISPSGYLKSAFEAKGYQVIQISNPIDLKKYVFTERKVLRPKLLYVRAFAKIYNPELAVKVLNKLLKTYPNAELCMVGPDRDGTLVQVKKIIHELGLEDKITITGVLPKEEWHQLSLAYDVFLNTTHVDNTPVSLIEVMALGLPIVSTNVGGIPFLMDHQQDATLVDPNDVEQMTQAILQLLDKPEIANSYSIQGRKKAEKMDWQKVKQDWIKVLQA